MLIGTLLPNLGIISPAWLALLWGPTIKKFEVTTLPTAWSCPVRYNHISASTFSAPALHVQVWRLVTNFLFLGKLSLNFVIRMIWVVQYGGQLEGQIYQFEPADFLFMLIFNGGLLLLVSIVMGKGWYQALLLDSKGHR
jgi:hypothetical protein